MNNICSKWKDQLLEAALAGKETTNELDAHLAHCSNCAAELTRLRARRERLDALLPSLAGAEPAADLANRILAAAKSKNIRVSGFMRQRWVIVGATAVIVIAIMTGWILNRRTSAPDRDLTEAMALAHWQAPTDVLLQVPNHELLNSVPKLGNSYLAIPMEMQKGEKQ